MPRLAERHGAGGARTGKTMTKATQVEPRLEKGAALRARREMEPPLVPRKTLHPNKSESVEVHVGPSELCKSTTEGTFARTRANEPRAQANAQRQQQHRSAGMKNSEEDVLDKDDEDEDGEDDDDDDANKNPL
mmetsp:Transcript_18702/g.35298  ORF Transcript_18702/g.35298 Transcript_18702/m.35298 type:complete len:133 (-) Transcript_18702:947-1345(-)